MIARSIVPHRISGNSMRLHRPVVVVPTLLALLAFAFAHPASAQAPSIFVITASEGYGIGDCLAERGACGRIVADAWCVAHGASHAVSFGPADGMAIPAEAAAARLSEGSLVISCGD
jgi:hypothetical protein